MPVFSLDPGAINLVPTWTNRSALNATDLATQIIHDMQAAQMQIISVDEAEDLPVPKSLAAIGSAIRPKLP